MDATNGAENPSNECYQNGEDTRPALGTPLPGGVH
jgi:hypothetical protein